MSLRRTALAVVGAWCLSPVAASQVCDTIESTTNIETERHFTPQYTAEQGHYWSTACGALRPDCILYPATADEVATIVDALREGDEDFAVKSGGHNPNLYFSSVDGGPLLSTKKLNEVVLDRAAATVRVGPGNLWNDVHSTLDGTGYTVVGGRLGIVGVGGLLLGAGMSFMSTEHGWAANSVLAYEVVLANGTLATVTDTSHPDLFRALRGGGNAFGIVTAFVLRAYRQGSVWGGTVAYPGDEETSSRVLAAVNRFALDYPDPKAAVIPTSEVTAQGLLPLWVVFLYYNGPEPPPGIFDDFLAIPAIANTCDTRSYADLLSTNSDVINYQQVIKIGTESTSLPQEKAAGPADRTAAGLRVLQSYFGHWRNVTADLLAVPGILTTIAFQPVPRGMARAALDNGGDLLDLDDGVDRVVIELTMCYLFDSDTPLVVDKFADLYGGIRERVLGFVDEGVLPDAHLPLFYNDGFQKQDYAGRLRPEMSALAKRVREDVDPEGLWVKRTGGFKF